jgi:hypothetical protein
LPVPGIRCVFAELNFSMATNIRPIRYDNAAGLIMELAAVKQKCCTAVKAILSCLCRSIVG